jgi:hypothetical protein
MVLCAFSEPFAVKPGIALKNSRTKMPDSDGSETYRYEKRSL